MNRIGIVTSGGDAPGINAAIRAIVRIAHSKNLQVLGFKRGWEGLITNSFRRLTPRSVSGIIHTGGTILHFSRCPEFRTEKGIEKACENLVRNSIDGLIVIGGDGSFRGALDPPYIKPLYTIRAPFEPSMRDHTPSKLNVNAYLNSIGLAHQKVLKITWKPLV